MDYALTATVEQPYDQTVAKTREALAGQGFGILTEIDIRATMLTGDALFNEVFLDEVSVPDECVVGAVNEGWKLARTTLANERVAMAGTKLGMSTEGAVGLLAGRESETDAARVGHQVALATVCQLLGVRSTVRSIAGHGPGAESSVAWNDPLTYRHGHAPGVEAGRAWDERPVQESMPGGVSPPGERGA